MFKKLGTTGLNGLMAILLLGMLILPLTSIGLAGIKPNMSSNQVLSAQDTQQPECVCPKLVITPEMEREIYEKLLMEDEEIAQEEILETPIPTASTEESEELTE